jgi:ribonuclease HI
MMVKKENKIIIFTDGASKGNPGPGGYGAVVVYPEVLSKGLTDRQVIELGGYDKHTTNNRMELSGAVSALEEIRQRCMSTDVEIIIYTDSKYLINGMTGWIFGWQKNDWKKRKVLSDGTVELSEVLNQDLWKRLVDLSKEKKIAWNYVGGHVGIIGNERCDEIASGFATGGNINLYKGKLSVYKINILDFNYENNLKELKESKDKKSKIQAYSYLSLVDGILKIDKTWAECEKRVKGKKAPKYQKSISAENEKEIIKSWGLNE